MSPIASLPVVKLEYFIRTMKLCSIKTVMNKPILDICIQHTTVAELKSEGLIHYLIHFSMTGSVFKNLATSPWWQLK